jgi:hypothetical protein
VFTGSYNELRDKPTIPTATTPTIANVTGLQTALDGKAATSHTHTIANVTGLQTTLDGKAATSHTHTIANVTGLQTALNARAIEDSVLRTFKDLFAPMGMGTIQTRVVGPDPRNPQSPYNNLYIRLLDYTVPVVTGVTVNSGFLYYKSYWHDEIYNETATIPKNEGIIVLQRNDFPSHVTGYIRYSQTAESLVNDTCQNKDILRVRLVLDITTALTTSRLVVCFHDTLSDFPIGTAKHIANITPRR